MSPETAGRRARPGGCRTASMRIGSHEGARSSSRVSDLRLLLLCLGFVTAGAALVLAPALLAAAVRATGTRTELQVTGLHEQAGPKGGGHWLARGTFRDAAGASLAVEIRVSDAQAQDLYARRRALEGIELPEGLGLRLVDPIPVAYWKALPAASVTALEPDEPPSLSMAVSGGIVLVVGTLAWLGARWDLARRRRRLGAGPRGDRRG